MTYFKKKFLHILILFFPSLYVRFGNSLYNQKDEVHFVVKDIGKDSVIIRIDEPGSKYEGMNYVLDFLPREELYIGEGGTMIIELMQYLVSF